MMKEKMGLTFLLMLFAVLVFAQAKEKKYDINGYQSLMQQNFVFENPLTGKKQLVTDNLLHNRINFKWFLNERWTFRSDLRTRVLWGEFTRLNGQGRDFAKAIDERANDAVSLSAILVDEDGLIAHTVLDRLFVEYSGEKWEVRLGRQRINWGINTVWNPNDIFNTASFFDFDYVEQPGSDAIRISRYFGLSDKVELAISPNKNFDDWTAGLLWKTNLKSYDLQFLAGWLEEELVLGTGWAGNIKNMGFKGEISAFINDKDLIDNSLSATTSFDYSFKNGWYSTLGLLYNSNGKTKEPFQQILSFEISPKNLYPYKWASFTQLTVPFNPLLNGSLAVIYSPVKAQPLFINPSVSYGISDNWELSAISQFVFSNDINNTYQNLLDGVYFRFKFSY